MRLRVIIAFAFLVSCSKPAEKSVTQQQEPLPSPATDAPVARITPAELMPLVTSGSVTVIDVRHADNYMTAHIPGSMHIPLDFLAQEAPYLSKSKTIVAYCT